MFVALACALAGVLTLAPSSQRAAARPLGSAGAGASLAARTAISDALGRRSQRFHIRRGAGGLRAVESGQGMSASFARRGFQVSVGAATFGLDLVRFGSQGHLAALPRSAPRAAGNQVTYARGPLDEWYRNGPFGLEQGFTVRRAPRGAEGLTLALALTGTMPAHADGRGGLLLSGAGGRRLSYGGLSARDARGRTLAARLTLSGRTVRIIVRARGAAYPITIDPFIQLTKVSDPSGSELGASALAVAGTTAAAFDQASAGGLPVNAVDIFVANPGGWAAGATLQARMEDGTGNTDDQFGTALALTSDASTLFVGAPLATVSHSGGPDSDEGEVFVFNRTGSTWVSTTTPTGAITYTPTSAAAPVNSGSFGKELAVTGTGGTQTLAIGIVLDNSGAGSVGILQKGNTAWGGQTVSPGGSLLTEPLSQNLGEPLAISGNTVVAGAPHQNTFTGAAFVFVKPGANWMSETMANATLTASDGQQNGNFASSLAISPDGKVIVVGAPPEGFGVSGKAYVFTSASGQWSGALHENAILRASDGFANDQFGWAVAVQNNTILVTANGATVNNHASQGAAYVFTGSNETWASGTQTTKFSAADGQPSDQFGQEAALQDGGATAILTAPAFMSPSGGGIYAFGSVPTSHVSVAPASPDGAAGWYVHPVTVAVSAADANSTVAATRCVLDPASAPTVFGALPASCGFTGAGVAVAGNGRHVFYAGSANAQGYAEPGPLPSATFAIDTVAPTVKCAPTPTFKLKGSGGLIVATVTDATSGAAQATVTGRADVSRTGRKTIVLTGRDNAGNTASVTCRYTVAAPRLNAALSYLYNVQKRYTVFTAFAGRNVPRGALISLRCKGHGCRFKKRSVKVPTTHLVCKAHHKHCRRRRTPALNTVSLATKLVNAHLGVGTVLTVDITQRNTIGQYWIIKIRSNKQPSVRTSCLAPGKTKPTKSCT